MARQVFTNQREQQAYNGALQAIRGYDANGGVRLDLSNRELTRLPPEIGQVTGLAELDLSGNRLTQLPPEIGQLAGLVVLNIGDNRLTQLPPEIGNLASLAELDLWNNQLTQLPPEIGNLASLAGLYLFNNQLTQLPAEIGSLASLAELNLSTNRLTQLPPEIGNLASLVDLNLRDNQLTQLPPEIGSLASLAELNLSTNRLTQLPPEIGNLASLASLYLGDNQLTQLPPEIGNLESLAVLNLRGNQLTQLPPEIGNLASLASLYLGDNQLTQLPPEIGNLESLAVLSLSDNQLAQLPAEIGNLESLAELSLSDNQLTQLPAEIVALARLELLFLHDNPNLNLPNEVLGPSWREPELKPAPAKKILDYYFRIKWFGGGVGAARPLLEARIIVVGDGAAGKTSLVGQLLHGRPAREKEETTRDVVIETWPLKLRGQEVRVNVWDFGGQEPMHAAHPYFFTERTVYLVVASARETGVEQRLGYWLRMVASHGKGARALVVVNKTDQHAMDLDRRGLCSEHRCLPDDPAEAFYAGSCTTGKGIAELREAIRRELEGVEQIWMKTPAEWFAVKTRIGAMRERCEDTLTFEKWEEISDEAGVRAGERADLLDLLRSLGLVVSFPGDPSLETMGVLNPEWVTRAIYPLLTCQELAESGGLLKRDDLGRLLDPKHYPPRRHGWLVELMKKFELLFADESGALLLPARLPKETPEWALGAEWDWEAADVVPLELRYPGGVLPEAVISRFIVRTHRIALRPGSWWRHGIAIGQEGCAALVRALPVDGKMLLRVKGSPGRLQHFLGYIRQTLRDLSQPLGGDELWVVLGPDVAEKYNDLLLLAQRESQISRVVGGRVQVFSLARLLSLIEPPAAQQASLEQMGVTVNVRNEVSNTANMTNENYNNTGDNRGGIIGKQNTQTNTNSFNSEGVHGKELTELFGKLTADLGGVREEMKVKDAKALDEKVAELTAEAQKPTPDVGRLSVTGKGLIEAATTVGEIATPVVSTVKMILKLFGVG